MLRHGADCKVFHMRWRSIVLCLGWLWLKRAFHEASSGARGREMGVAACAGQVPGRARHAPCVTGNGCNIGSITSGIFVASSFIEADSARISVDVERHVDVAVALKMMHTLLAVDIADMPKLFIAAHLLLWFLTGLVFPKFASSRAEMVAAGVIPIDRLTDIRAPVEVVAARCGRKQLEAVYGLRRNAGGPQHAAGSSTGNSSGSGAVDAASERSSGVASTSSSSSSSGESLRAGQLLVALAVARGWAQGGGLPDEARAGRKILKDYTAGKLLYCKLPPGGPAVGFAPNVAPTVEVLEGLPLDGSSAVGSSSSDVGGLAPAGEDAVLRADGTVKGSEGEEGGDLPVEAVTAAAADEMQAGGDVASSSGAGVDGLEDGLELDMADLELMEEMGAAAGMEKSRRAEHKFHKKAARSKGTRGVERDGGGYDGAQMVTGKKGGLVRVGGY